MTRSIDVPVEDGWAALAPGLGLPDAGAGDRMQSPNGAGPLPARVRRVGGRNHHQALVDLEAPGLG